MRWTTTAMGLGLAAGALFVAAMMAIDSTPTGPSRRVDGTVTAIVADAHSRFRAPTVSVMVRAPGDIPGRAVVPFDDLRCHVGDKILALQTGVAIKPDPTTCESHNS